MDSPGCLQAETNTMNGGSSAGHSLTYCKINGKPSLDKPNEIFNGLQHIRSATSPNTASSSESLSKYAPIAIVGMSCRLPGKISTVEEFWELCSRACSGWSKIPPRRFNHTTFYHKNPDKLGCYNSEGGHFLEYDPALFDAPFFNITEKEAIS
jgi:hypothetical protein